MLRACESDSCRDDLQNVLMVMDLEKNYSTGIKLAGHIHKVTATTYERMTANRVAATDLSFLFCVAINPTLHQ